MPTAQARPSPYFHCQWAAPISWPNTWPNRPRMAVLRSAPTRTRPCAGLAVRSNCRTWPADTPDASAAMRCSSCRIAAAGSCPAGRTVPAGPPMSAATRARKRATAGVTSSQPTSCQPLRSATASRCGRYGGPTGLCGPHCSATSASSTMRRQAGGKRRGSSSKHAKGSRPSRPARTMRVPAGAARCCSSAQAPVRSRAAGTAASPSCARPSRISASCPGAFPRRACAASVAIDSGMTY